MDISLDLSLGRQNYQRHTEKNKRNKHAQKKKQTKIEINKFLFPREQNTIRSQSGRSLVLPIQKVILLSYAHTIFHQVLTSALSGRQFDFSIILNCSIELRLNVFVQGKSMVRFAFLHPESSCFSLVRPLCN